MTHIEKMENLLDNMSCSSVEAREFNENLLNKDIRGAKKILLEHMNNESASELIDYLMTKNNQNVELVEIMLKDIPLVENDEKYVIRLGTDIYKTSLYRDDGKYMFFGKRDLIPMENVHQIWKIKKL